MLPLSLCALALHLPSSLPSLLLCLPLLPLSLCTLALLFGVQVVSSGQGKLFRHRAKLEAYVSPPPHGIALGAFRRQQSYLLPREVHPFFVSIVVNDLMFR